MKYAIILAVLPQKEPAQAIGAVSRLDNTRIALRMYGERIERWLKTSKQR
jgi:hypothetical protein